MMFYDAPIANTKVTVELGELLAAGFPLWDFEYPSYYTGEAKRAFEQKIVDHYFFRQIGQETPARFKHYFKARMREIMPYYIELYKSAELLNFDDGDVLKSYDLTETYTEDREDTGETSSTSETSTDSEVTRTDSSTSDRESKFSNTPQGSIANLDSYLTEATVEGIDAESTAEEKANANGSSSATGTSTNRGTVTHSLRRVGNIGVQTLGEELNKNRAAILNIDMQIIEELGDLFLKLY